MQMVFDKELLEYVATALELAAQQVRNGSIRDNYDLAVPFSVLETVLTEAGCWGESDSPTPLTVMVDKQDLDGFRAKIAERLEQRDQPPRKPSRRKATV